MIPFKHPSSEWISTSHRLDRADMEISVNTSDPASAIRSFPWPVLEAGNGAFSEGVYSVVMEHRERGRSFELSHKVEGAALIERLIDERKVRFACAVAAPVSAFRHLRGSLDRSHLVQWDPDDLGAHPLFTPMILSATDMRFTIEAGRDGVNALWDGRTIDLPKGARLAIGPTFALQSGLLGLLDFRPDDELEHGQFRMEANREGGFRFNVHLASNLHRFLRSHRQEAVGWNIMTHIVSAALAQLHKRYCDDDGEEGWRSYANLVSLAEELERRGLPHWAEDEFEPELAATTLYPHKAVVAEDAD